ncbi:citrate lyase subunit beta [Niallia circulans]|jgi:citrate lyase beta subunit|uniref:Citrate lyase subunit beta n=1 Tax=Niallia circulans TaxID=1397 RepID=A0A0J1LFP3_NIACI|nr:HpcH/HpaI aldolase/citrate lyase family protein [Niallia circulans]KLV27890.1 citrate lyase subunit beta [Niallia circulans]MDR4314690.1 HpcH/HpaI aldolase/citrate lyase family protein [Niallia circulans]MED3840725.1 HpcH/HpaI aldolase/citrate lyase family protein [Niallia circulans]MED4242854.1 HpcH/HpaI aldolase/citrate lyase family protein [Niallia circulans]MED4246833.1 HpcH/HpaI aldolase/citrate lyase family protein [Niallia circulans]
MKLFSDLNEKQLERLFFKLPEEVFSTSEKEVLSYALASTLYMPATRPNIYQDLLRKKHPALTSMVICLEDSIGDHEVDLAERKLVEELTDIDHAIQNGSLIKSELPLIFIRIRSIAQFLSLMDILGDKIALLTGIVIPKFEAEAGEIILKELQKYNKLGYCLYAMPILETKKIIEKETRMNELLSIKKVLDDYKHLILNVRIGATDFCGLYGIRRSPETTIYDIAIIRDCISDIINIFTRADSAYVVSGPVWEYFTTKERFLIPQLRETPFRKRYGKAGMSMRTQLIDKHMDGLIREVMMDITNGLTGKTIIHPTHIKPVQALNVVSYEEYLDALNIMDSNNGEIGVIKSSFSNKMNEIKPHLYWAQKIILKSKVYGVFHEGFTYIDLLKQENFITNH